MPNSACFVYVLEGGYDTIGQTEVNRVQKNEAVLLHCGNYIYKTIATDNPSNYESLAIHFDKDSLKKIYEKDIPSFLKSTVKETPEIVKLKANKLIDRYVKDLLYYFENPFLVNDDILILKLKEIILLLMQTQYAKQVSEILSHLYSPSQASFKEIIEANIFSDFNNEELAMLTNRSLTSFKREFKHLYGLTPTKYIMHRRIEAAKQLLEVSSKSIGEIAFETGFKDLSHFSKLFKGKVDVSPSNYRKNFLE